MKIEIITIQKKNTFPTRIMSFYCYPLFGLHFMRLYKQPRISFSLKAIMWCVLYDAPCTCVLLVFSEQISVKAVFCSKHVVLSVSVRRTTHGGHALAKLAGLSNSDHFRQDLSRFAELATGPKP